MNFDAFCENWTSENSLNFEKNENWFKASFSWLQTSTSRFDETDCNDCLELNFLECFFWSVWHDLTFQRLKFLLSALTSDELFWWLQHQVKQLLMTFLQWFFMPHHLNFVRHLCNIKSSNSLGLLLQRQKFFMC